MNDRLKCVQNSCDMILTKTELHADSAQAFASHDLFKLQKVNFCFFTCLLEVPSTCAGLVAHSTFLVDSPS